MKFVETNVCGATVSVLLGPVKSVDGRLAIERCGLRLLPDHSVVLKVLTTVLLHLAKLGLSLPSVGESEAPGAVKD